nr:MalY/PatB family protein [Paenibacillus bovis]
MRHLETFIDRKNTASLKWDALEKYYGDSDLLPMWVADMDFQPPEEVINILRKQVEHGIFGYTISSEQTNNAIINWTSKRHNWNINSEWILFSQGVVPAIGLAIEAFTEIGDKVMLQSPVYTPFFQMINNNNREVVNSPLVLKNGHYEIDFVDFEEKLKSGVKLFLLCSPHNPGGRVWTLEELTQIAELCKKYNVLIAADEIHADLALPPHNHIPIASLDNSYTDFIVTFMAPSKTFNLAGLQAAFIVAPNKSLRNKIVAVQQKQGLTSINTFGILGMQAAYEHGEEWLDNTLAYIQANIELIKKEIKNSLPTLEVIDPEGTYLVWIDCRKTGLTDQEIRKRLLEKGKLAVNFGNAYGPGGEGFIRINTACHRSIIEEGLQRLKIAFTE